jgi:hypothetical protein
MALSSAFTQSLTADSSGSLSHARRLCDTGQTSHDVDTEEGYVVEEILNN